MVAALIDLLCRNEADAPENEAVEILTKAFEASREYRFKLRADDIRMKQLKRKERELEAGGDAEAHQAHKIKQMNFELEVFAERAQEYPTDLRLHYEYGFRLFRMRRYDDAIPVLQEARNEPKVRLLCSLYLGRCFFEKGYHGQAAETFRKAIELHETPEDKLGKELHYWLGRTHEAEGRIDEALKTYGQLIEWDYNYRKGDVRKRMDQLRS
jgi:tetratricopeptide (TPR) repeat protein